MDDWPKPGQSETSQRHYSRQHVLCPSSCSGTREKPVGRQNSLLVNHSGKLFGRLQIISGDGDPESGLFCWINRDVLTCSSCAGYPQCSGSSCRVLAEVVYKSRSERSGGVLRQRTEWHHKDGAGEGGTQRGNRPEGTKRHPHSLPPNDWLLIPSSFCCRNL